MPIIQTGTYDDKTAAMLLSSHAIKFERDGRWLFVHDPNEHKRGQAIIDREVARLQTSCARSAADVRELFHDAKKSQQAWNDGIMQKTHLGDDYYVSPRECLQCGEWVGGDADVQPPADDLRFCSEECRKQWRAGRPKYEETIEVLVLAPIERVKEKVADVLLAVGTVIKRGLNYFQKRGWL